MLSRFLHDHHEAITGAVYRCLSAREVTYVCLEYPGGSIGFSVLPWDESHTRMDSEEMLLAYLSGKGEAEAYRGGFNDAIDRVRKWSIATGVDPQLIQFLEAQAIGPLDEPQESSPPDPTEES